VLGKKKQFLCFKKKPVREQRGLGRTAFQTRVQTRVKSARQQCWCQSTSA
jgi:hypothetical protein